MGASNNYTTVHEREDEYGIIRVLEDDKIRVMCFEDDAPQSALRIDVDTPEMFMFEYVAEIMKNIKICSDEKRFESCLLLGLGGGTIAESIDRQYPDTKLKIVELREAVGAVAKEYFKLPEGLDISYECGIRYPAKIGVGKFDVIIVDMYGSEGMVPGAEKKGYSRLCQSILNPGGIMFMNLWPKDVEGTPLIPMMKSVFSDVTIWRVSSGNHIVIATK